jgi:hypothetical protein
MLIWLASNLIWLSATGALIAIVVLLLLLYDAYKELKH